MSVQNFSRFVRFQIEFLNGIKILRKVLTYAFVISSNKRTKLSANFSKLILKFHVQEYDLDSFVKDMRNARVISD
jgi:hypothetical protein